MDSGKDAFVALVLVPFGAGLLIASLLPWALVSFVIAAIIAYYRYRRGVRVAEEDYDEIAHEAGMDLPIEETLELIGFDSRTE
jgi:hypothetical protein